ncbi:hypothetical protein [Azospirillum sp. sgz301742]
MRALKIAIAATFAAVLLPAVAFADDFEALCETAQSPQNAKICKCAAGKLTGADRTAAMEAVKAMKAAMASGKPEEAVMVNSQHAKGVELMMTAQATCL